jgi:hypothetical protein
MKILRHHSGRAVAHGLSRRPLETTAKSVSAAKLLSKDVARRIAANIAKLPEPLKAQIKSPGVHSPGLPQVEQS